MWNIKVFTEEYSMMPDAQTPCLLIPGWSFDSGIFEWLLPGLAQHFSVSTADIECLPETATSAQVVDRLAQLIVDPAWIVGWSLGGNFAIDLAYRYPEKVLGLCLLATTPCFSHKDDWLVGMDKQVFARFQQGLLDNSEKALRKFDLLQTRSDIEEKALRHALEHYRKQQKTLSIDELGHGLTLLGEFDQRSLLPELTQPMLWCFGEMDAVVNVYAAQEIQSLVPRAEVEIFRYTAHLPFLTNADRFFNALLDLYNKANRQVEKKKVANAFSKAAITYDQSALLQQSVAGELIAHVEKNKGILLDAGCGTGYWIANLADKADTVIALDMAHGMLKYARQHSNAVQHCIESDLEVLPLAHHSITQIFSSLAVQWCDQPRLFLEEWHRVLKPGGRACIATLGENTLFELRESWKQADSNKHVNRFLSVEDLSEAIRHSPFTVAVLKVEKKILRYPTLKALMVDLKNIGAQRVVQSDAVGLMGKKRFSSVEKAYESYRDEAGMLPATYEVIYLVLEKHV